MATIIDLDDAPEVNITVHESEVCSLTFTLSDGDTWSANAKIKLGVNYDYAALKTYAVGTGLTIVGQELTWRFNPSEWGNRSVVYDVYGVRVANAQRDWRGRITVNKSFE